MRFEERNENLLTARIQPKSNVLPVLAAHFADRLQPENWIILDTIRRFAAIHPAGKPYFLQWGVTEEMLLSVPVSDHEKTGSSSGPAFLTPLRFKNVETPTCSAVLCRYTTALICRKSQNKTNGNI